MDQNSPNSNTVIGHRRTGAHAMDPLETRTANGRRAVHPDRLGFAHGAGQLFDFRRVTPASWALVSSSVKWG